MGGVLTEKKKKRKEEKRDEVDRERRKTLWEGGKRKAYRESPANPKAITGIRNFIASSIKPRTIQLM